MGIRTYYHGIWHAGDFRAFFCRRDKTNPYTSYQALSQNLSGGTYTAQEVQANLWKKVMDGFISLEELVSGGRASLLFSQAGIYDRAVAKLAQRRATLLTRKAGKLEKFLVSGKAILPYVIEKLDAEGIALALCRVSKTVRQRAVRGLIEEKRLSLSTETRISYQLVYDDQETTTKYFPANISDVFCFKRKPSQVLGINRGVVLTDAFVANMGQILDALDQSKTSPLDHVLIWLRGTGGRVYPSLPSSLPKDWPSLEEKEFVERDHFSREARTVLHEAVTTEYNRMVKEGGEPLSFRVYVVRPSSHLYEIALSWEK